MSNISSRTTRLRSAAVLLATLLSTLLLAAAALAQSDTIDTEVGTGGRNVIQGNVYVPSGRRLEKRVRVRLGTLKAGDAYTMTDSNGAFYFRRLAGGTYRVTVEAGQEYETASETVDILDATDPRRTGGGQTYTLQIQLQMKGAGGGGKPAAVDAALGGVPKPARELYEKALKAAQAGEHKKAIGHLEGALKLHPDFALAHNELGAQLLRAGEIARALEAFRAALKLAPDAFVLRLNYGIALVRNKEYGQAEAELHKALEQNRSSTTARLYRGRALIGLDRYAEAEQELLQVATTNKGSEAGQAYRYLGAIYMEAGDKRSAVVALERALALNPEDKDAAHIRKLLEELRAAQSEQ